MAACALAMRYTLEQILDICSLLPQKLDNVTDRPDLLIHLLIVRIDAVLILKRHDQLHQIDGIRAEVILQVQILCQLHTC